MYLASILLLMLALPAVSVAVEGLLATGAPDWWALAGKWFTFWAVGVRLFVAGISQVLRPEFTSEGILGVRLPGAEVIVRELGFANLAFGTLGILSLAFPEWRVPAALAGAIFLGLDGVGHVARGARTGKEQVALASDLAAAALLAAIVVRGLT